MYYHPLKRSREYTNLLAEKIEDGLLDPEDVLNELIGWLSESEVKEFYLANYATELGDIGYDIDPDSE
jgi:hypothetical protein